MRVPQSRSLMLGELTRISFRLPLFVGIHLLISGVIAAEFAWRFGHDAATVASHVALLAAWDIFLASLIPALGRRGHSSSWAAYRVLLSVTATFQLYLYALDAVSNASWGRNITAHLVVAFAPTVWSG